MVMAMTSSCGVLSSKKFDKPCTVNIATTAYTSKERDHLKYGAKNAMGTRLEVGQIATSWDLFPVGTKLKIDNHIYTVTDYGSALVNKTRDGRPIVDIYQPSRSKMNKWGVRYFDDVEVVEWGDYDKSLKLLKDRTKYRHCRHMYEQIKNRT